MPPGTVVDAFKSEHAPCAHRSSVHSSLLASDLIRHGRAHNHRQDEFSVPPSTVSSTRDSTSSRTSAEPTPRTSQSTPQSQTRQQDRAQAEKVQQQQAANVPVIAAQKSSSTAQQYSKEIEQIVQEERAGKEKMPVYKGLERFKLVDKMGEYVRPIHLDDDMIL